MTDDSSGAGRPVVIVVDGELDASDGTWGAELRSALRAGHKHIVVDMLGVSFIDSSVVRQLVEAYRDLAGGWLRVVYTHHLIRRVVSICGLADVLPQYTSVEAALRGNPSALRPSDDYGYAELGDDEPDGADDHVPGIPSRQGSAPR